MAAKIAGCSEIVAVDRVDSRLELARSLGATRLINTNDADAVEVLQAGGGMDFTLEASGVPQVATAAILSLNQTGTCGLLGTPPRESVLAIDWAFLSLGRTVKGIVIGDGDPGKFIPELIDHLMAGRLPLEKLVKFYAFDEINQAMADSMAGTTIKPIIRRP